VLTRTTGAGNPGKMAGRLMREVKTGEENRRILGTGNWSPGRRGCNKIPCTLYIIKSLFLKGTYNAPFKRCNISLWCPPTIWV